ncbi:ABC transporter permease [uncultured Microbacterium sp.]|uniref:ABC-type dipeptide/oligopeptide/nickel transport system, permease component n=1 Tax=uncultured Microbacterium sp. TaxID=191216 RepID=A0A1Y5P7C5_9MICO|nr:ABC transporter permease [uncultured Microbacterium sp.]SBS72001.1 ABC-type dipeptide/oligopeptide/nickel transport system, permease component [uncultured Microbacterium sp.]
MSSVRATATRLWSSGPAVRIALAVLVGVALVGVFGPALAPYDPLAQDTANALQGPSLAHWLGTDYIGRDVVSRLLAGAPLSLLSALLAMAIGLVLGAIPGILSVFAPRAAEWGVLRTVDALLALPFILFAIAFAGLLGNGVWQAMIAIGILLAPGFFRVSRAAALTVTSAQYVEAATLLGASSAWLARRHVWRAVAPTVAVAAISALGGALLVVSSLTFLGIGIQPPTPTWGGMLASDLEYLSQRPLGPAAPALAIIVTVGALNLLADASRDALGIDARRPGRRLPAPARTRKEPVDAPTA